MIGEETVKMVPQLLGDVMLKLQVLGTSDHASVVSINLFVALLCACIVLGHLLEESRWMNESITALLIVSFFSLIIDFIANLRRRKKMLYNIPFYHT